jgi:hypothetical protein
VPGRARGSIEHNPFLHVPDVLDADVVAPSSTVVIRGTLSGNVAADRISVAGGGVLNGG